MRPLTPAAVPCALRLSTLGLGLALAAACAADPKEADGGGGEAAYLPPDQRGPYLAGTALGTVPGSEGVDLPAQVWFPASEGKDSLYSYDGLAEGTAINDGVPDCSAPRPVVMFSHGNTGIRFQSIFLTEQLASRGWVVVAPDHVGNTLFDYDGDRMTEVTFRRPIDIQDSFDWLIETEAGPGGPLEGCVDPDAGYAMVGHSFGGYTTFAVTGAVIDRDASAAFCAESGGAWLCPEVEAWFAAHPDETVADLSDPRAWAGIPMTPAGYEALLGGLADIAVPTMVLGGSLDTTTPVPTVVTPLYEGLTVTPRALGVVEDAGHYTFSDACAFLPTYPDCEPPFIDQEEAHALINTLSIAWLDRARGFEEAGDWLLPEGETRVEWSPVD